MKALVILLLLIYFSQSTTNAQCPTPSPCIEIDETNDELFTPRVIEERENITPLQNEDPISFAKAMIGTPYLYGGNSDAGIDCSAFVRKVFWQAGINLPRTAREQFTSTSSQSVNVNNLKELDLLFFSNPQTKQIDHVAIYLGNGEMIHSSSSEGGVAITSLLFSSFWSGRFFAAKRLINQENRE